MVKSTVLIFFLLAMSTGYCFASTGDDEDDLMPMTQEQASQQSQISESPQAKKGQATVVRFLAFVLDIDGINDVEQNFDINLFVVLQWQDDRLANDEGIEQILSLDKVWNPRLVIANQQGRIHRALPETVTVSPDGLVTYRQRFTGKISQPLDLKRFPMDSHRFITQFTGVGHAPGTIEFVKGYSHNLKEGGGIAEKLSLPDWHVTDFTLAADPYEPIPEISSPGFIVAFKATRIFDYYIWQIILPLTVVIVMSWSAFWISANQVSIRIGIATSSILTLIAHRFVLASLLPKLPYMTRLDYLSVLGTVLVLLALVMVMVSAYFNQNQKTSTASRIDWACKILFPLAYMIILGRFLIE